MLYHYGNKFEYIWLLKNKNVFPAEYNQPNIYLVKYLSLKYFYHCMTAGFIINNVQIEPYLPLRRNQVCINTWHGMSYKNFGFKMNAAFRKRAFSMKIMEAIRRKMTNYNISPAKTFNECISENYYSLNDTFLNIGMPRNDIFFRNFEDISEKIFSTYNVNRNYKIVLYAPTFRGDNMNPKNVDYSLDSENVLKTLKEKFGFDFILFYRTHYIFTPTYDSSHSNMINVSSYPDMQELLCATDVLITDYSSSIWDFSFTQRPCFLFAPDLESYQEERNFFIPIEEWPFPIAENNDQLINNIKLFDEAKYKIAVKQHQINVGSYETGTATEQFCRKLFVQ
jgi:CDP-glycerol glycerophosphotransferase